MATNDVDVSISQSIGEVNVNESAFLFFGPPKIGKTTIASGFPNAVFLATSKKELNRIKAPYILVNEHKKLMAAIDYLIDNRKKLGYKVVVLDFIDAMYTNCETYICKKLKIEHPSEASYGKGVGMIGAAFKKEINKLIGSRYGVVMISHMQVKEIQTMHGTVSKTVTTLPDRARQIVIPLVSVIGYVDFETVKVKDPDTGKTKFKKKRMIMFEPSEFLEAGDRDGYLPSQIPCFSDPKKTYQLISDYYTGKRKKDAE